VDVPPRYAVARLIEDTLGAYNPHAWLKSGAIEGWEVATVFRAEIFAPPHAFYPSAIGAPRH
jgi:hypothetical protein